MLPADVTPAHGLPKMPPDVPPLARPQATFVRDGEQVVFAAACPECGVDAAWLSQRIGEQVKHHVDCYHCFSRWLRRRRKRPWPVRLFADPGLRKDPA